MTQNTKKFYILQRIDDAKPGEVSTMVALAFTNEAARAFASRVVVAEDSELWKNHLMTSCEELRTDGPVGIVIKTAKI